MAEVFLDLTNKMRNADNDDNNDDIDPVDPEASAYVSIFDELHSELYPECPNMYLFNFLVKLMHLKCCTNGRIGLLICYVIC